MKRTHNVPRSALAAAQEMDGLVQDLLRTGVMAPGAMRKVRRLGRLMRRNSVKLGQLFGGAEHRINQQRQCLFLGRKHRKARRLHSQRKYRRSR